ncbi:MAG: M20/M25/M40 family metallo-hydrolase [Acidobacteriota bacterium]
MSSRFAAVAVLALTSALVAVPAARHVPASVEVAIHQVSADELRATVTALASDDMAGRGVGHPGNQQAEHYIADAFRDAGVLPAAATYLQPVEVYQPRLGTAARFTASTDGQSPLVDLTAGFDFYPLPESSDRAVTGPLILAGYGISAAALHHDDYAGISAAGAIVLVLDDAPETLRTRPGLSNEEKNEIASLERKITDAQKHGAAGLIVMRQFMGDVEGTWPSHPSVRSASYRLFAPMGAHPLAVAAISETAAAPLRRAVQARQAVTARLSPDVIAHPIVMDNILGMVEGRLGQTEMVVVGAHLDHDGLDEAGRIYNGADDNASGTAAVLAMASAFARAAAQGVRPARAVVFALWNGEEKGSLGAEHYVTSPVPARRIVANVNLDMVGRNEDVPDPDDARFRGFPRTSAARNTNVVHLLGYTYSPDLARIFGRANETIQLTIKEDYDRDAQGLLHRSDNWPFLEHGVPAVFLTTGLHPDYHTPEDDTERIDFAKLERITELACRAAWITADGDAPRFKAQ